MLLLTRIDSLSYPEASQIHFDGLMVFLIQSSNGRYGFAYNPRRSGVFGGLSYCTMLDGVITVVPLISQDMGERESTWRRFPRCVR